MEKQNAIVEEAMQSVEVEHMSSCLALLFLTRPARVAWVDWVWSVTLENLPVGTPWPMMILIVNQSPCLVLRCRGSNTICLCRNQGLGHSEWVSGILNGSQTGIGRVLRLLFHFKNLSEMKLTSHPLYGLRYIHYLVEPSPPSPEIFIL